MKMATNNTEPNIKAKFNLLSYSRCMKIINTKDALKEAINIARTMLNDPKSKVEDGRLKRSGLAVSKVITVHSNNAPNTAKYVDSGVI